MTFTLARLFSLLILLFSSLTVSAEVYRFTGAESQDFSDPANWEGGFPGIIISEQDQLIIEAPAIFDGPLMIIHGGIRIETRASLTATQSHVQVTPSGWIDNRGTLDVFSLITEGVLMNQAWAFLAATDMSFEQGSENLIQAMSEVRVAGDLTIAGRSSLSGSLYVGNELIQEGELSVSASAVLEVGKGLLMDADTVLYYHPQAILMVGDQQE